jgi:hypothetical protein
MAACWASAYVLSVEGGDLMMDGDLTVVLGGGVRGDHAGDGLRHRGRVAA